MPIPLEGSRRGLLLQVRRGSQALRAISPPRRQGQSAGWKVPEQSGRYPRPRRGEGGAGVRQWSLPPYLLRSCLHRSPAKECLSFVHACSATPQKMRNRGGAPSMVRARWKGAGGVVKERGSPEILTEGENDGGGGFQYSRRDRGRGTKRWRKEHTDSAYLFGWQRWRNAPFQPFQGMHPNFLAFPPR